jgi:hypothetical protein
VPSGGRATQGERATHAAPPACQRKAQNVGPMVPAHRGQRGLRHLPDPTGPAARRAEGCALDLVLGEDAGDPPPDMKRPRLVGRAW